MPQSETEYVTKDSIFDIVFGEFCACSDETEQVLNSIIEQAIVLPAADVAPVVHAYWINLGKYGDRYNWRCSSCKRESIMAINYCPSCGAKMDGDKND